MGYGSNRAVEVVGYKVALFVLDQEFAVQQKVHEEDARPDIEFGLAGQRGAKFILRKRRCNAARETVTRPFVRW